MTLPRCEKIALTFALANVYKPSLLQPGVEYIAMPKLNGIRAMWVPDVGFVSRDGIPYETGVLPHLESQLANCKTFLDGELYKHGMSLQDINSRGGVNRKKPHPDHEALEFHAFDNPYSSKDAETRMELLALDIAHAPSVNIIPWRWIKCPQTATNAFTGFVASGYEGAIYKHSGSYVMGRSNNLLKRKAWHDEDFDVVECLQGVDGKYSNSLGAIICRTITGETFHVGSFAFDDATRDQLWQGIERGWRPTRAKVKYLDISDGNKPYNTQCLLLS